MVIEFEPAEAVRGSSPADLASSITSSSRIGRCLGLRSTGCTLGFVEVFGGCLGRYRPPFGCRADSVVLLAVDHLRVGFGELMKEL